MPTSLTADYQAVVAISRQMAKAASELDWSRLTALGSERAALFARLPRELPSLPPETRRRLAESIDSILACDAEIRERAEPWLEHAGRLLLALGEGQETKKVSGDGDRP